MHHARGLLVVALTCALSPSFTLAASGGTTPGSGGGGNTLPAACQQLFGLKADSMVRDADRVLMTPETCAAYEELIRRYNPGNCSQKGLVNPRVEGITRLNPSFVVALAKTLKEMPGNVGIISAFRTPEAQNCVGNGATMSNHKVGCAVDLNWDQNSCGSAACQWMLQNGSSKGVHIRMQHAPEWNHIEPKDLAACRAGKSIDVHAIVAASQGPSYPYAQQQALGYGQGISTAQGPCPTGYVYYNNQCYALQNNQPLGAAQQPFQASQPMQSGQSANIGQPSYPSTPVSSGTGGTVGTSNTNTSNNTGTGSTKNLNLVEAIINGTSTATGTTVGTPSAFSSNSLSSTASYGDGTPASDTLLSTATHAATNTLTFDQLTSSQGTFSTTDIGTAADITATSSSSQSFLRVALENLRRRLAYLLEVLGLMRRGAPTQEIQNLPLPVLIPVDDTYRANPAIGD